MSSKVIVMYMAFIIQASSRVIRGEACEPGARGRGSP